jgi:polyketide cyclase/dehydrase/lipid transport protein
VTSARGEIIIIRPVEEVFDFVADERHQPLYNPWMISAEQTSPGPIGPGTRFRAEIRAIGWKMPLSIEFTSYERPGRLARSTHSSMIDTEEALTFEPAPGGTRMRWSRNARPRGVLQLISPITGSLATRRERTIRANLKRFLESRVETA